MNKLKSKEAIRRRKNERAREYYDENSKSIREKRKKRYQKTREREKQYSKMYYEKFRKNKKLKR